MPFDMSAIHAKAERIIDSPADRHWVNVAAAATTDTAALDALHAWAAKRFGGNAAAPP
jgi:hypothetical protein